MNQDFLYAINKMLLVQVTVDSKEAGIITRKCIPFDYGPSEEFNDGVDRYYFYDLDSPNGRNNFSVLPTQLIKLVVLDQNFDPMQYITWNTNWIVSRNWGSCS